MRLSPDTHDARPTGAPSALVLAERLACGALGSDLLAAARRAARAQSVASRPDRLSIPAAPVDPDNPPRRPAA